MLPKPCLWENKHWRPHGAAEQQAELAAHQAAQALSSDVTPTPVGEAVAAEASSNNVELALSAFQKGGCAACHTIPGVPGAVGTLGPDLSEASQQAEAIINSADYTGQAQTAEDYIRESIIDPAIFLTPDCPGGPCQAGLMPPTLGESYTPEELDAVVEYLVSFADWNPPASDGAATETDTATIAVHDVPELLGRRI